MQIKDALSRSEVHLPKIFAVAFVAMLGIFRADDIADYLQSAGIMRQLSPAQMHTLLYAYWMGLTGAAATIPSRDFRNVASSISQAMQEAPPRTHHLSDPFQFHPDYIRLRFRRLVLLYDRLACQNGQAESLEDKLSKLAERLKKGEICPLAPSNQQWLDLQESDLGGTSFNQPLKSRPCELPASKMPPEIKDLLGDFSAFICEIKDAVNSQELGLIRKEIDELITQLLALATQHDSFTSSMKDSTHSPKIAFEVKPAITPENSSSLAAQLLTVMSESFKDDGRQLSHSSITLKVADSASSILSSKKTSSKRRRASLEAISDAINELNTALAGIPGLSSVVKVSVSHRPDVSLEGSFFRIIEFHFEALGWLTDKTAEINLGKMRQTQAALCLKAFENFVLSLTKSGRRVLKVKPIQPQHAAVGEAA